MKITVLIIKKSLLIGLAIPTMASSQAFAVLACVIAAAECANAVDKVIDTIRDPKTNPPKDVVHPIVTCTVSVAVCAGAP